MTQEFVIFHFTWWLKLCFQIQNNFFKQNSKIEISLVTFCGFLWRRTKDLSSQINRSDLMTRIWQSLGLCGCVAGNVDPFPVLSSSVCQIKYTEKPTSSWCHPQSMDGDRVSSMWMGRRDWLRWRDMWILQISLSLVYVWLVRQRRNNRPIQVLRRHFPFHVTPSDWVWGWSVSVCVFVGWWTAGLI